MTNWPWPAPLADDGAAHLVRGTKLPHLELPATAGGPVNLATEPRRTAVFVYPWTGRPGADNPPDWDVIPGAHGSTPGLQAVANLHSGFASLHVGVVALSGQDTGWQAELAERLALPFPILSDAAGTFRDGLRLPTFETGGVRYLRRLTLVISSGRIERVFHPAHPPDVHPREVLAWMSATATYAAEARLKSS